MDVKPLLTRGLPTLLRVAEYSDANSLPQRNTRCVSPFPKAGERLSVRGRAHRGRFRKHPGNLIQPRVSGIDSAGRGISLTPNPTPNPSPTLGRGEPIFATCSCLTPICGGVSLYFLIVGGSHSCSLARPFCLRLLYRNVTAHLQLVYDFP